MLPCGIILLKHTQFIPGLTRFSSDISYWGEMTRDVIITSGGNI